MGQVEEQHRGQGLLAGTSYIAVFTRFGPYRPGPTEFKGCLDLEGVALLIWTRAESAEVPGLAKQEASSSQSAFLWDKGGPAGWGPGAAVGLRKEGQLGLDICTPGQALWTQ